MRAPPPLRHTPTDDLDALLHAIELSEAVMLVQPASVLYRPWTLLQVYTALCLEKPLICVHVEQGGYDHFAAKQLLANLREELDHVKPGAYAAPFWSVVAKAVPMPGRAPTT